MTQLDTVGEDQLRWALAFATTSCPECGEFGGKGIIYLDEPCNCEEVQPPEDRHLCVHFRYCMQCSKKPLGYGCVYALEGVRRECPAMAEHRTDTWTWGECCCHEGEAPMEGLEAWLNAAATLHDTYSICHVAFSHHGPCRLEDCDGELVVAGSGDSYQEALLRALAQLLAGDGAELAWREV